MLCEEFPCKKMKHLMSNRMGMLLYCLPRTFEATQEEYNLCMTQFDSMPFIIQTLIKNGKTPDWWKNSKTITS